MQWRDIFLSWSIQDVTSWSLLILKFFKVFVQSSDSKRALVSAQALLHGLYPVIDPDDQFDPNLNWLPIAVHSTGANNEARIVFLVLTTRVSEYELEIF